MPSPSQLAHPHPSSLARASTLSLPNETLAAIFEFGAASQKTAYLSRKFLRNASFVCSQWRGPAERALCSEAVVLRQSTAKKALASKKFGFYPTRQLMVGGTSAKKKGAVAENTAEKLLEGLSGIKGLTRDGMEEFKFSLLGSTTFAGESFGLS